MEDMTARIEQVRSELRSAESEQGKLEGRLQHLSEQKAKVLAGFKELGIKAKDAPAELQRLEGEIEDWLVSAEQKIEEFRGTAKR